MTQKHCVTCHRDIVPSSLLSGSFSVPVATAGRLALAARARIAADFARRNDQQLPSSSHESRIVKGGFTFPHLNHSLAARPCTSSPVPHPHRTISACSQNQSPLVPYLHPQLGDALMARRKHPRGLRTQRTRSKTPHRIVGAEGRELIAVVQGLDLIDVCRRVRGEAKRAVGDLGSAFHFLIYVKGRKASAAAAVGASLLEWCGLMQEYAVEEWRGGPRMAHARYSAAESVPAYMERGGVYALFDNFERRSGLLQ